ncbi:MAG: serine acetyltransferase [Pseudomonadota bacterium]
MIDGGDTDLASSAIRNVLHECCPADLLPRLLDHPDRDGLEASVYDDAASFARKDPATGHDIRNIFLAITSYQAVLHYRISHWLLHVLGHEGSGVEPRDAELYALLVAKRGKLLSGADIHPKCTIGKRFILDHGYGNVIGETAVIGDDVYCNGGVILGSARIFGNTSAKRHPTLGNNVQIGGLVGIYGPITIGNDVFIGARCTITECIPDGSRVVLKAEHQVVSP